VVSAVLLERVRYEVLESQVVGLVFAAEVDAPPRQRIAVTMEIYTEAPSDATRDALRKLGDWLA
jgi:hypothetical protein